MNFVENFKKFDYLGKALNFIIKNSDSNYSPYHNLNHNITVTNFAYYIGQSEGLKKEEMKELLIAAIFHDFNHTAGEKKDDTNIQNSKNGVKKFIEEKDVDVDLEKVYDIINATEYPYTIDNDKLTKQQEIIRDADLMQLLEPTRLQANWLGLSKEVGVSFVEWLKAQKKFVSNCEFNTSLGKKLKERNWKKIEEELEYLTKITS